MYVSVMSSDTLNPHELAFAGSRDPHPGPACGRFGAPSFSLFPFCSAVRVLSVVKAGGDRDAVAVLSADRAGTGILGQDGSVSAQPVDQACGVSRCCDAHRPWAVCRAVAGEKDGERGQMGQDLVLADIGVAGPCWAGSDGGGMPVAAPVATGPGATALTRMPVAATSSAADRVKPFTVCLLAR